MSFRDVRPPLQPETPGTPLRRRTDEPFPLAPMQHAMWVGRHDNQRLGGVAGHLYVEFDGGAIDPERLRRRPPDWRCATRCCGCGSCPTAPSGSRPVDGMSRLSGHRSRLSRPDAGPSSISGSPTSATPSRISSSTARCSSSALSLLPGGAIATARRSGHAGRRRDELSHPDG